MSQLTNTAGVDPLVQFGRNVRSRRVKIGMKQEELAHASGLARTYAGDIERGKGNVSLLNFLRLIKVLKCDANDLLDGVELPEEDD